jgi:hypothetical protein
VLQSANRANIGGIGAPGDVRTVEGHASRQYSAGLHEQRQMVDIRPGISDDCREYMGADLLRRQHAFAGFIAGYVSIWRAVAVALGAGKSHYFSPPGTVAYRATSM